jgi:cell division protein FtsI (penicillin-binding protein 3)
MSDDLSLITRKVIAERGNIYTYDGRLLSTTLPTFDLYFDTKADGLNKVWDEKIDSLCWMLSLSSKENKSMEAWKSYFMEARSKNNRYLKIAKKLTFEEYKLITSFPIFREGKSRGLIVDQNNTRKRPFGLLAQRTIGYVGQQGNAQIGIEGRFNNELSGENKEILMQRISDNFYMPINENSEFGSKPGLDIYTTIDVNLQDVAEAALLQTLKNSKAHHGCVILSHVKTGAIRAIANLSLKNGEYVEDYNYAIGEANEPGSVIKLASVMALIDEGFCDENTKIDIGNGETTYFGKKMVDNHKGGPEVITLAKAFENSSNVGISKPIFKHFQNDKEKYYEKLEQFHLTKPFGIEIKGEAEPLIKKTKEWSGLSLPWMSIGYEMKLTPLQILCFYAAVANNGKMMKPYLVSQIKENQKVIENFEPIVLSKQIAKSETIKAAQNMLQMVVDSGTAKRIKSNYQIAGKTGTNLITYKKNWTTQKKYQASFVGYFPAKKPEYACIVVINDPTVGSYYGSDVSAPVFKKIADRIYTTDIAIHPSLDSISKIRNFSLPSFKGIKKDVLEVTKNLEWKSHFGDIKTEWITAVVANNQVVLKPSYFNQKLMPNLKSMSAKDAVFLVESMGLRAELQGRGKILSQSIAPGEKVYKGFIVKLILG